ncbi:MAG: synthase, partial [Agromyces sp.]|nr:synthase [Agromyces sp.]
MRGSCWRSRRIGRHEHRGTAPRGGGVDLTPSKKGERVGHVGRDGEERGLDYKPVVDERGRALSSTDISNDTTKHI